VFDRLAIRDEDEDEDDEDGGESELFSLNDIIEPFLVRSLVLVCWAAAAAAAAAATAAPGNILSGNCC